MSRKVMQLAKKPEVKRENSAHQAQNICCSQHMNSPADRILLLKRTYGNQAVGRLIRSGALQAKLKIGKPGDRNEQEADRVAEKVVVSQPIRHKCARCSLEEEEKIQAKTISDPADASVADSFVSNLGSGQPLDSATRAFFEPRFGYDFSQVRVHTDAKAAEAARDVNANAFTVGGNVVFGEGKCVLGTTEGRKLMAHELAHVIQQGSGINSNRNTSLLIQRVCRPFEAGWIHPRTGRPAPGGTWCETIEEARERAQACPSECFIFNDGPTTHRYRPIPGYPCAHYVAHELGITEGGRSQRCYSGFSVMIPQIISGRHEYQLVEAQINDIYIYPGGSHSGIVRQVDARDGRVRRVRIQACAIEGTTYMQWRSDGSVYR